MADLTAATFVVSFPEFGEAYVTAPGLIQGALDQAALMNSEAFFKGAYQRAVFLHAAHILACSPHGENLRGTGKPGESMYWVLYEDLRKAWAPRVGLSGGFFGRW